ncbi:MAG: NAD-binding protein, partial [Robiginitomaculum sp.]|nr:NAD-binding protein [Robiginitomaculum sp.]
LSHAGPQGLLLVGANPWSIALAKTLKEVGTPVILADQSWQNLRPARLNGIKVFHGEVLSENAEEKLDHTQIDWLLCASSNEAYNALVCVEFAPELGRHKVFQFSVHDDADSTEHQIIFTARGRTAMARGLTYDTLIRDYWQGWRFAAITLDDENTLETVLAVLPEGAVLVAERAANGAMALLGPSRAPKGGEGAVLIVFAPKGVNTNNQSGPSDS